MSFETASDFMKIKFGAFVFLALAQCLNQNDPSTHRYSSRIFPHLYTLLVVFFKINQIKTTCY
ncbi:hypothetical protein, partial [Proteus mirabilis]|uniref:hypothetical protein n=1 Tax=Proteus mirabilis TaxID=584 RepID=UPI00195473E0